MIYMILLDLMSNCHQSCNYGDKSSKQYCMFLISLSSCQTFSLFVFLWAPFNLLHTTCLFLCPPNTSANLWLADVFRGYRKRPVE